MPPLRAALQRMKNRTQYRYQRRFACLIHAMYGKDVLGEINSNGYDSHDFPSQVS